MMITNVRGTFSGITGTVIYDAANLGASSVEAEIDASTINTGDEKRDAHLKSPDFLDVEKYPKITFKSKSIAKAGDDVKVTGDLTIHGVTREVVITAEPLAPETKDPWGGIRTGTTATTKIKRSDFGLTWNSALETGGFVLGDELKLTLDIQLVKVE
ncbi:MAG: YceI family protein [Bryobacterales bacterium]|nr:YceI family protein [Bryobacterales bacterium]